MLELLLVSSDKSSLSGLASALNKQDDITLSAAESGEKALAMVSEKIFDLVVTDEKLADMTGLALAKRLISINPMINCVAVSSLSEDDFHEASEGLGLMDQLPVRPGEEDAEKLLRNLRLIKSASRSD